MSQQTDGALLSRTNDILSDVADSLDTSLIGPLVDGEIPYTRLKLPAGSATRSTEPEKGGGGAIADLRRRFVKHARSTGEFPGYCDVGVAYFKPVYDWHVRYRQPVLFTRDAENRMMIQFMFTQLVLRSEMDDYYCGLPYDR